jgi:glycosyltransferase involved in cell wall biosynthesis
MSTLNLRSKVTIGIPVYNEVRFIRETLESAIIQNATVVVSDNASTDGTSEICQEYADRGLIQYIRHPENQGAWRNFMYLAEIAVTPYFMWLGGHDILAARYVNSLLEVIESTKDYLLCASNYYNLIDIEGYIVQKVHIFEHSIRLRSPNSFIRTSYYLTTDVFNAIFQGLYKLTTLKEILHEYKDQEISGGFDVILIARLLLKGKAYCSDAIPLGYSVREVRGEESFYAMMQRQKDAIKSVIGIDDFIEIYIKKQVDALGDFCEVSYINCILKKYIHNKIKKKILLRLLIEDIKLYADGKQNIEELKKQLKLKEEKINVHIFSFVFWDWVSVICLYPFVKKMEFREITLTTYLEIRRNFEQRGLRMPLSRCLKWHLKYIMKEKWRIKCSRFFKTQRKTHV